jgi:hypothetical protein
VYFSLLLFLTPTFPFHRGHFPSRFSLTLICSERVFPQLLVALCNDNASQSIKTQQALAKQLADVFDFVLQFDDCKMVTPGIQNDFSFYRRTLNRMKLSKEEANAIKIRDELANRMSLFFAYPTPMMRTLSETTVKCLDNHNGMTKNSVIHGLAVMANICQDMVEKRKFSSVPTNLFCLRAMTGCIILVDSINEQGAFYRKSPINVSFSFSLFVLSHIFTFLCENQQPECVFLSLSLCVSVCFVCVRYRSKPVSRLLKTTPKRPRTVY